MYRITYIHKGSEIENPLYTAGDQDYCLTDARLDLEMGMAGELNIYVPETNPARYDVECLTDEVIVYRNEEEIFRGRPITVQMDFVKTGQLTCEGILAYLYDTYFEPFEFEGSPKELLTLIINNHNSHVEERKRFTVGDITVIDNNDYINRSSIYYDRSLNVMTEKLIKDSLGGYFRVRVDGGVRYLDYLENYDTQATQMVQYGENILDIATDVEYSDLATVILPLGARLEDEDGVQTDEYTTIASVNGGSIYYEDPAAVEEYGWICVCVEWEDVTIPDNLLTKAKQYLEQVTNAVQSFRINAVDLSLVSDEYEAINVGDYVYVRSVAHGINQYIELTAMTLYPLAPENDVLQFGGDTATLTDAQRNSDRSVQTALGSLSMRVTNLTATVINAVYANIEEIVASTITTDYIRAAVADMGYVTIDYLIDNYASIQYLEANYASIIDLEAALANVELLNADVANILNVLAGNVGTGDLQTIVLTADNAIIDDAIIINALMGTVLADIITSNVIYTDYIKIANNEDQSLWIDGSTMQFTDENGVVRVQIGLDASGNYNYYLWDADGNLIWDPMGLTEAGLTGNGAIIKDAAVADDANISAYKLNIEELTSVLNENGDLILSAEQVTIGGGTLDYALTEITQQIENLEALDAVEYVENWYILGGPDAPPWEPGEDGAASILGEMILGEAVLGTSHWTTEQPKVYEGEYVWFSQKIVYTNGDVLWTTPTLLTDEYVRSVVSVQQTELEVVQGQIQAKIWQTDITEATTLLGEEIDTISEQYGVLTILVDTIDERVGALTTTVTDNYEELSSQVTAITATLDGINAEVREVYAKNPLTEGVPYYAVSYSPDSYPPFEWEDDQTAVLGEAILGEMVLGVNGESNWTTDQPEYAEGQYIWIAYLRTRLDGSTYWTTPTLLTDEYLRENVTEMSEKYAQITMAVDDIREEVVNVQATLSDDYSTTTEIKAVIDAAVSDSSAEILQEVSYTYAKVDDVEAEFITNTASLEAYVDSSIAAIDLNVSGGLGNSASIILSTSGGEIIRNLDLSNVRQAFADDDSTVFITGGLVAFSTNTFEVDADNLQITTDGRVITNRGNYETIMDGGYLEFYYNSSRTCYFFSDQAKSVRIQDAQRLWLGSTSENDYRGIGVVNTTAGIQLQISNDSLGTIGVIDQINGDWLVAREIYANTTYLGTGGSTTVIRGSNISVPNDITISGSVDCAGLASTNTISLTRYSRTISLNIASSTDRGLYDNTYSRWLIAAGDDNQTYVGNTSVQTNIRGAGIRASTGTGYFVQSNNYGTIQIGTNSNDRMGMYDADTEHWIVRRDENARINLGNTDWDTILYGKSVYLNGTTTAVTSDRQFKDNIEPFEPEATDNLTDKLTPKIYTVASDPETKHIGFIVDEVEDAMRAAGYDPDEYGLTDSYLDEDGNEMGAIRYDEFIPILLYEIQELRDRVNALENPEEGLIDPGIQLG